MKTILVIEDEAQTRHIFLKCLEFEGFQAYGASNGTMGMELTRHHHPDLVICDVMMPDMDGYSVLAALRRRQETADIPLIFLTAKVTMADLRRGMELGADDYLTKPCTLEQFLAAIHTRLERKAELSRPITAPSPSTQLKSTGLKQKSIESFSYPHVPKLDAVFQFIETHYPHPINLDDIAQVMGYSPAYLSSLVQIETGQTIKRWIIARRMAQARTLLACTTRSVRDIAESCGYPDAGYFTRQFRKSHGQSPQAWRQDSVANLTN